MRFFRVAYATDCEGQAQIRADERIDALLPGCSIKFCNSPTWLAAGMNMIDVLDARLNVAKLFHRPGAILCNNAPREDAIGHNGAAFAYGVIHGQTIISTVAALAPIHKMFPEAEFRLIDHSRFIKEIRPRFANPEDDRVTFSYRGYETVPQMLAATLEPSNLLLTVLGEVVSTFAEVPSAVGVTDVISGKRYNAKLTLLPTDVPNFAPGKKARIWVKGELRDTVGCYATMGDMKEEGEPGLYVGSSGFVKQRFLELCILGGSIVEKWGLDSKDPVRVEII